MLFQQDLIAAFEQFNEAIYNYVFFRVNRSKETAEDLTQEIFLKAWRNRDKFDEHKSNLKNWLFVIARNTVIDYYRQNKVTLPLNENNELNAASDLGNVEDKIFIEEVQVRLQELTIEEREILLLRYFEDFDLKEIAEIINKNYSATKVLIHRSLKKLKALLAHETND